MKKKIEVENTYCDICEGESCYYKCLICGKDVCYDCKDKHGVEYKHAVLFSGSGDGYFCNDCLSKEENNNNKILLAYKRILSLINEEKAFYDDFRKRCDVAENELRHLNKKGRS